MITFYEWALNYVCEREVGRKGREVREKLGKGD